MFCNIVLLYLVLVTTGLSTSHSKQALDGLSIVTTITEAVETLHRSIDSFLLMNGAPPYDINTSIAFLKLESDLDEGIMDIQAIPAPIPLTMTQSILVYSEQEFYPAVADILYALRVKKNNLCNLQLPLTCDAAVKAIGGSIKATGIRLDKFGLALESKVPDDHKPYFKAGWDEMMKQLEETWITYSYTG